jgi:transposase-like protein
VWWQIMKGGVQMKKRRYSEEQIIRILREVESGSPVAEVARQYGVSEPTIFRWKRRYGGLSEAEYNSQRPHSALGYMTPEKFANSAAALGQQG